MSTTIHKPLVCSESMFADIKRWYNDGYCIVLYNSQNKESLVYHQCQVTAPLEITGKNLKAATVVDRTNKIRKMEMVQGEERDDTLSHFRLEGDIAETRVIYLDCANEPHILDKNEGYPHYLEQDKCHRCFCKVTQALYDPLLSRQFSDVHAFAAPQAHIFDIRRFFCV